MQLLEVLIGQAEPIENAGKSGQTGIFKRPVAGKVEIGNLGLAGDVIVDRKNHGGVDQAVYVFGEPDYAWWQAELGRDLPAGTFGENLLISDMVSADYHIGDLLRIGDVLLQISAPRIPCATLAARMGDPKFVKRFSRATRPGFYCRVLQGGAVQAGDAVEIEAYAGEKVNVLEIFNAFYEQNFTEPLLRRFLSVPVAERARVYYEYLLAEMLAE